jgi:hypothetical protein
MPCSWAGGAALRGAKPGRRNSLLSNASKLLLAQPRRDGAKKIKIDVAAIKLKVVASYIAEYALPVVCLNSILALKYSPFRH